MKTATIKGMTLLASALVLFATAHTVGAQGAERQQVSAGGLDIYYGFLPAEIAARHMAPHEDEPMHGQARRGHYHLMVALYNEDGERLEEAELQATVGKLGMAGTREQLEPMTVGETITFGNYFPMRSAGQYRILLEIQLPDADEPIEAQFDHEHR